MAYLTREDVTIYYECFGSGEPVVLIHGMGLSHQNWQAQREFLHRHGFQTIVFDIRGHGRSTATMPRSQGQNIIKQMVDDTRCILDECAVQQAAFVGYSTGTLLCQAFAITYPQRVSGLFLSGAFPKISNVYLYLKFLGGLGLTYANAKPFLAKAVARSNGKDEEQIQLLEQEARKVNRLEAIRLLHASLTFDCRQQLGRLALPMLVTYGGNERYMMTYRQAYLHYAPSAEICLFPNVNHATLTKSSDRYNAVLLDFLQRLPADEPHSFFDADQDQQDAQADQE